MLHICHTYGLYLLPSLVLTFNMLYFTTKVAAVTIHAFTDKSSYYNVMTTVVKAFNDNCGKQLTTYHAFTINILRHGNNSTVSAL